MPHQIAEQQETEVLHNVSTSKWAPITNSGAQGYITGLALFSLLININVNLNNLAIKLDKSTNTEIIVHWNYSTGGKLIKLEFKTGNASNILLCSFQGNAIEINVF